MYGKIDCGLKIVPILFIRTNSSSANSKLVNRWECKLFYYYIIICLGNSWAF